MAGKESCRERKSVSSKVTIRNSTTLIEHSEGHSTGLLQEERSDYETAFLQPLNIGDRKGVFISKKTQEEISEIVYVAAAGKLTIGAFVEHILRHHLEIHRDEIDVLFEQQFRKRFER